MTNVFNVFSFPLKNMLQYQYVPISGKTSVQTAALVQHYTYYIKIKGLDVVSSNTQVGRGV